MMPEIYKKDLMEAFEQMLDATYEAGRLNGVRMVRNTLNHFLDRRTEESSDEVTDTQEPAETDDDADHATQVRDLDISPRAKNALVRGLVVSNECPSLDKASDMPLAALVLISPKNIMKIRNFGPMAFIELCSALVHANVRMNDEWAQMYFKHSSALLAE